MKFLITAIVILSFLGIAVFGVFAMNHGGEHGYGCIAATAQGVARCPNQADPLAFLTFHIDAFKSFSTAIVGSSLASMLLVALALVLVSSLAWFFRNTIPAFSSLQAYRRKQRESFALPSERQLIRWLALHENSPASP